MKILFLGDVMGRAGRAAVAERLPKLREAWKLDFVVVNGENASGGMGLTAAHAKDLFEAGADCVTLGDHAFDQKDMMQAVEREGRLLRPLNYAKAAPGRGNRVFTDGRGRKVLVAQVLGNVFMRRAYDDPFSAIDAVLRVHPLGGAVQATVVDVHCEAQILPGGTAFQGDAGMCGDYLSVIGMDKTEPMRRFVTGMTKDRFTPAMGAVTVSGVYIETDDATGRATRIEMVRQGGRLEQSGP